MQILYLGPECTNLINYLRQQGHEVTHTDKKIDLYSNILQECEFIVSFGYRHIITGDIISRFSRKIINLHISLLPWNKGADPNLWSFLENTPKGVTIHYLDEGIDTGDIIAQKELFFAHNETLRSTYNILSQAIQDLFIRIWPDFIRGAITPMPQLEGTGSFHYAKDKKRFEYLLTDGWDTRISTLIGKAI
jgi:methionyl-tRNA formyltransferase